jgi:lipoprotein NlpI
MSQAVKAAPQDIYAIIWRYVTSVKTGDSQPALRELSDNAEKLKETRWPFPVINFYLGKIDEKGMYAAADTADPKKKAEQICEANFYLAEAKLLKANVEDAIPLLRAAEKECPPSFYEAHAARAELKRLGRL